MKRINSYETAQAAGAEYKRPVPGEAVKFTDLPDDGDLPF